MALKVLAIDIETSPVVAYSWGLFNQNLSVDQIILPHSVLCFAAKWVGDKETSFHSAGGQLSGPRFARMIRDAHKLLSEADAVLHFNGEAFDIPRLNAEFLRLGLTPPPPSAQIDLKKVIMKKFAFTSSKLAFVGPALKIGEKVKNSGWDLWKGCLDGDSEAWDEMERYNRQDTELLEKLYRKLLPWIDNHPNMNLYVEGDDPVCPNCGSGKLQRRGVQRNATLVYRRYLCSACGKWSRGRVREKSEPVAGIR